MGFVWAHPMAFDMEAWSSSLAALLLKLPRRQKGFYFCFFILLCSFFVSFLFPSSFLSFWFLLTFLRFRMLSLSGSRTITWLNFWKSCVCVCACATKTWQFGIFFWCFGCWKRYWKRWLYGPPQSCVILEPRLKALKKHFSKYGQLTDAVPWKNQRRGDRMSQKQEMLNEQQGCCFACLSRSALLRWWWRRTALPEASCRVAWAFLKTSAWSS